MKQIAAKKARRANIAVDFSSNAAIKGTESSPTFFNLTSPLSPSDLLFQKGLLLQEIADKCFQNYLLLYVFFHDSYVRSNRYLITDTLYYILLK